MRIMRYFVITAFLAVMICSCTNTNKAQRLVNKFMKDNMEDTVRLTNVTFPSLTVQHELTTVRWKPCLQRQTKSPYTRKISHSTKKPHIHWCLSVWHTILKTTLQFASRPSTSIKSFRELWLWKIIKLFPHKTPQRTVSLHSLGFYLIKTTYWKLNAW